MVSIPVVAKNVLLTFSTYWPVQLVELLSQILFNLRQSKTVECGQCAAWLFGNYGGRMQPVGAGAIGPVYNWTPNSESRETGEKNLWKIKEKRKNKMYNVFLTYNSLTMPVENPNCWWRSNVTNQSEKCQLWGVNQSHEISWKWRWQSHINRHIF